MNLNSLRPLDVISTHLRRAYPYSTLSPHRDENLESGTKPSFTCWNLWKPPGLNSYLWFHCCTCNLWSISNMLLCWNIAFCYLQLWYPGFCNELDHFWELSPHLIGKLGLHCSGPLLSVSFGALLLKKWACEHITVDKSLWLHVKNRIPMRYGDTESLYSICNSFNSLSPNSCLSQCTWLQVDRVANFEPDRTFPVLVRATWVIFKIF